MEKGEFIMNVEQGEIERKINVIKLTEGLDFGEGSISVQDRLQATDDPLSETTLRLVETGISSDQIIVPIDTGNNGQQLEDDGCGDGRGVKKVFHKHKEDSGEIQEKSRSLHRSKIFGGGLTMAAAAVVGTGKSGGKTVEGVFDEALTTLKTKEIPFGAHTDDHAHGDNCGCGAIDKAPQIFDDAVKYEDKIRSAIDVLGVDMDGLDEVYDNLRSFATSTEHGSYSGQSVMKDIVNSGVIIKELGGPHLEVAIVLNTLEGYTVNQELIREISGDQAQVFATDIARLEQLSKKISDDPVEQQKSFLSMVVYTLATAATLTKGDLPVYVVSKQPSLSVA